MADAMKNIEAPNVLIMKNSGQGLVRWSMKAESASQIASEFHTTSAVHAHSPHARRRIATIAMPVTPMTASPISGINQAIGGLSHPGCCRCRWKRRPTSSAACSTISGSRCPQWKWHRGVRHFRTNSKRRCHQCSIQAQSDIRLSSSSPKARGVTLFCARL